MTRPLLRSGAPAPPSVLFTLAVGAVGGLAAVGALALAALGTGQMRPGGEAGDRPENRIRIGRLRVDRLQVKNLYLDTPSALASPIRDALAHPVNGNEPPPAP